jgi:hypothetical protein
MKFEENPTPETPYGVTVDGEELQIVAAAFRERVYQYIVMGNSSSISRFDADLAGWEEGPRRALLNAPEELTDVLDAFHERTEEVIAGMPADINVPAFANPYISKRHQFGEKALKLADQIREEHTVSEFQKGLEGDPSAISEE